MLNSQYTDDRIEAGCDEAGRGALAGPLFAAAVILPKNYTHPLLTDSKQLTRTRRESLRTEVEREALAYAVSRIGVETIDEINILRASFLGMEQAVQKLIPVPELLLIDGNRFHTTLEIPYHCLVKGDARFLSIAAASVLAKTYRDEWMEQLHADFPLYAWNENKGYPTPSHHEAIALYGITPHHRRSFRLERQLKILF
ncbi:MAG: ribonuclease HII [Bacteroidetes bacterium]|nr:MAG: ribonuclease HII [Bacteroidota bacterium]